MSKIFSIGYANRPPNFFLQQLKERNIDAVADIRSVPFSRAFADYHQDQLRHLLRKEGIHYVYLGEELGPRSKDPAHYDEQGQVLFHRLRESALFQQGIERLRQGMAKSHRIALLCAEKDPATCHRSLLVAQDLLERDSLDVQHILHDGELESHLALLQRLVVEHGLDADLLVGGEEAQKVAFEARRQQTSYRRPDGA